ncbi:TlpA family protein disulfide reductase [Natrarchaeobius halalkaliphilus]|uniref:TlpA family protein disulfide reductase n=1 Tax=Natrarchaeobius halalkaliphilus TaxID=1679091 RepID=A0A3N6P677_9EURY|nr:TlpA family protein disulfide reductase [Natrarchaeobius halalkaliphilus]RQG91235.1 TlpA family protein disulfide reductase [Natrarchaeobius halalkaliphilus]
MKRRSLIVGSVGLCGLSGCLDDSSVDEPSDSTATSSDDDSLEPPFTIRTVDAPGSPAGEMTVPRSGALLVNFTRMACPTSAEMLSTLGTVSDTLSDDHDHDSGDAPVRLLSVTDPTRGLSPSETELAEWWDDNDGRWPVGIDSDGRLNRYYDVAGFPMTIIIDSEGTVHWRNRRGTTANNVLTAIDTVLEDGSD